MREQEFREWNVFDKRTAPSKGRILAVTEKDIQESTDRCVEEYKKIEREGCLDLDEEFKKDRLENVIERFASRGRKGDTLFVDRLPFNRVLRYIQFCNRRPPK